MAHFVSLRANVPSPEDDIDAVDASPDGSAMVGLWGMMDGAIECEVKVVSGPGVATKKDKRGSAVRVWALQKLTAQSKLQAFSGVRPFTEVLPVRITPASASLAEQNKALLEGGNPEERAVIDGAAVPIVPLSKGIGDYRHAPKMERVRGLAVHITAGMTAADGYKETFESRDASTHFVIGRDGKIVQYVATSIRAQAQGPGNGHFLSVEMVGGASNSGACQAMTETQLRSLRSLWAWVRERHPGVPNKIARTYSGTDKDSISPKLASLYRDLALQLAATTFCAGHSPSIAACIDSWGLSCHYWLDNALKPCPGIAIMGQLSQVVGQPRMRVDGDEKFIL